MHGTVMQTGYSPTDQSAQVISISGRQDPLLELKPFSTNNEHLQALELEARLMVAVAALRRGAAGWDDDETPTSKFPFLPEGADVNQAKDLLEKVTQENRCREGLTTDQGLKLNFVEFCDSFELDEIERKIVLLLLMQFSSSEFYATFESSRLERHCDNGMEIGVILSIITGELGEQLAYRRYFAIDGSLMRNEVLHSDTDCLGNTQSIIKMSVYLQERFVRRIVGDNNRYHAAFRFIKFEKSIVRLEQVVLPEQQKQEVVRTAERFLASRQNGTLSEIDEFFGYGTGLAYLFHGPSGTGKTMLAKGLANYLSCPLVSLNMEEMSNIPISDDDVLELLFREAALMGGIVFLDECDDIFSESFNTRRSRALLMEIEKARCITILATNKAVDLDPAMDRRISMKVLFSLPDEALRLKMWQALIPPRSDLVSRCQSGVFGRAVSVQRRADQECHSHGDQCR
ncbi:hypothetical protein OR1_01623 [Geobacter sp. OR-1]|uniref:AAA family ATPase n=1 Tax=Geobacter sp. OR-1 TaxID=1266765 RepID=UPI000543E4B6|nr:ATP-binding protein [Geobacter sp. OR-1]GAM09348.1 hypothetical protein OR1_01623 [Geobacter sp. OR-1]